MRKAFSLKSVSVWVASLLAMAVLAVSAAQVRSQEHKPLLMRDPSISKTQIVFAFGNTIWIANREGGTAVRLTSGGHESHPRFSPDGTMVAFTGEYEGNSDVYVVPATGGVPKRLTYHPGADEVEGWSNDGKYVLFNSAREAVAHGVIQLFMIPAEGGFETLVPFPRAVEGSFSPDGARIAYQPIEQWQPISFKRYRGGQTRLIWIAKTSDSSVEGKIPRENSNDFNPMWVGDTIYFLSDRNGPITLFAYDTKSKQVKQLVKNTGFDLKSASAGPGAIVYEQLGSVHLYDLNSGSERAVEFKIAGDFPEVRAGFKKINSGALHGGGISPTGARAVVGARGDILTIPAEKGDIRSITNTTDIAELDPAWSPDGKSIAYLSDESGEWALHVKDQSGQGPVRKIKLGDSYYREPTWSPDSKKIAFTDMALNVSYMDLDKGTPVHIDADTFAGGGQGQHPQWSPDSRWIVYTKTLKNHLRAACAYSLEQGKSYQLTDGMSDVQFAHFDKSGKYLYFTASTDDGMSRGWLDMSSIDHRVTSAVYVMVLRKDLPSPLAPQSDEEKSATPAKTDEKEEAARTEIDMDNISQRILALPLPEREYAGLAVGKAGVVFVIEGPNFAEGRFGGPVQRFDFKTQKAEKILDNAGAFIVSFNGEKALYEQGGQWFIGNADKPEPGKGALNLSDVQVYVDPHAEWKHIYHQIWRNERIFFYDPNLHGVNVAEMNRKYEPFLDNVMSRDDLNYLFSDMVGEMSVGHMWAQGGDIPQVKAVPTGLLGADYKIENGRYRFARVYNGENWNPQLRAPLTQPGVNVSAGEYLLAVNGRDVRPPANVYSFFVETAGRQTLLRVGPNPDGSGARDVTVVPVEDEGGLRHFAWVEGNRRKVDELSGGRVAYAHMPDTADGGFTNFNRYYFAQVGKEAAIVDERFNQGGDAANYVIDVLKRPLLNYFTMKVGEDITTPIEAIFGPKVMIINEMAGSGGDWMPWAFHHEHVGTLVGKQTWGGLVGGYGGPSDYMDGGGASNPDLGFYTTDGKWEVENHGVPPDVEVDLDPHAWREGHDTQLEKAVQVALDGLKKNPPPQPHRPPYPNYHQGSAKQ
jgi:tricorn protease